MAKNPGALEPQLKLASTLRFAAPQEAILILERVAKSTAGKKTKARAHAGLAICRWRRNELEKAERHLAKARTLWPQYEQFMDIPVDAYIKAMRLFEDWAKTDEAQVLDQAFHWYETFLRNKPLGEGTPLLRLSSETMGKLHGQERLRQLGAKYGVWFRPGPKAEESKRARWEKVPVSVLSP